MDVEEQPWEGPPPKRFLLLLFVDWLVALIAAPHGDYSDTPLGFWTPLVVTGVLALIVAGITWFIIRRDDPARFSILSNPIAWSVTLIAAFFVYVRRTQLIEIGAPEGEATRIAVFSLAGLAAAAGIALITIVYIRLYGRNRDAGD